MADYNIDSFTQDVGKFIRTGLMPMGGSIVDNVATYFLDSSDPDDWRVRLSVPTNFMGGSAILGPLKSAGGLVFPYTPTITFGNNASYDGTAVTHQNYQFLSYQNSTPNDITINAPFYVEDAEQGRYWIAVVHFLRAVTKMYTGDTAQAGSPPPILSLNAYGDFVFKNVPVVVRSFTITLGNDCDYITTKPKAGLSFSSISDIIGTLDNSFENLAGGALASLVDRESRVPTKSDISVVLSPIYSRDAARRFSLADFVNGSYLINGGYI